MTEYDYIRATNYVRLHSIVALVSQVLATPDGKQTYGISEAEQKEIGRIAFTAMERCNKMLPNLVEDTWKLEVGAAVRITIPEDEYESVKRFYGRAFDRTMTGQLFKIEGDKAQVVLSPRGATIECRLAWLTKP